MGIEHTSNQVATPAAGVVLDKLYKDPALTKYDVFVIDALDTECWPSQAAPVAGSSVIDISPADGADGTFAAPLMGFDGGFVMDGTAIQTIALPASCQPATTSRGNIAMVWLYLPAAAGAIRKLFGWMRSGPVTGSWGAYLAGAQSGLQVSVMADGVSATLNLPASDLYLFALGRVEDGAGGFQYRRRIIRASNAADITKAGAASGANAAQPSTAAASTIGGDASFGASAVSRFYRMRMVDVKQDANVATAAWFDTIVDAEFALNRARSDWKLP
ncbi:hypothetical protein NRB_26320 [Novosphingobium sp. 11B]